jgi:hypothetical protein
MNIKGNIRKFAEMGIGLTAITVLLLAGCGGGGGSSSVGTTTTNITPFKGMFSKGNVKIYDREGKLVQLSGDDTIHANGVASVTYPSDVKYPLVVSVSGTYLNEVTGASEVTGTPLRSFVADATTAAATSGVPVTAVTAMAVAQLEKAVGASLDQLHTAAIVSADATNAISAVVNQLGISNTVPSFDPATGKATNSNTVALAALARVADSQPGTADLATKLQALALSWANNPASSVAQIMPNLQTNLTAAIANDKAPNVTAPTIVPKDTGMGTIIPNSVATQIGQAKTLLTSLRTNVNLLANSSNTGFIQNQASAVQADFQTIQKGYMTWDLFMRASQRGANMLLSGAAANTTSVQWNGDFICIVVTSKTIVKCAYRQQTATGVLKEFGVQLTDTTPNSAATATHTYNWTEAVCNDPTLGANLGNCSGYTTNPQSGTVTATNPGNSIAGWTDFHFSGNIQPMYQPTAPSATQLTSTAIDITATSATSGANVTHNMTGTLTTGSIFSVALLSGTTAVNVTSPNGWGTPVSGILKIQAKTSKYQLDGTLDMSNFAMDASTYTTWSCVATCGLTTVSSPSPYPKNATFIGSISGIGTNVSLGQFMTGAFTTTMDRTPVPASNYLGFDVNQPISPSNYPRAESGSFVGTIVNRTVSPAMTYTVNVTAAKGTTGVTYNNTNITMTYTDPSNNTVTVTGTDYNGLSPTIGTATMGGITITGNNVYAGTPTTVTAGTATLIGTISGPTMNFIDGTLASLQ